MTEWVFIGGAEAFSTLATVIWIGQTAMCQTYAREGKRSAAPPTYGSSSAYGLPTKYRDLTEERKLAFVADYTILGMTCIAFTLLLGLTAASVARYFFF